MEKAKIRRITFANVSGFLVYNSQTVILVDTGHTRTTGQFSEALTAIGRSPGDVRLIVLTHTHFDHSGGAADIKKLTGAPLAVHASEAGFLRDGRTPFPRGTRWKGKVLVILGRLFMPRLAGYPPVEPDILVQKELDLRPYGIPGRVVHTPGHTAGSVSVLLESGDALVGDNVLGLGEHDHFPPFANDCEGVLKSWEIYTGSGMKNLFPAHGGRVGIETISGEILSARRRYLKN